MNVMNYQKEFQIAQEKILQSKSVILVPHVDPDPDALCSCYAMWKYITGLGKKAYIGLQAPLFPKYTFIFGGDCSMIHYPADFEAAQQESDLIVALDIGVSTRGGTWIVNAGNIPIINLDHHIDNDNFGFVNVVEAEYSSTCELVYDFFLQNNIEISKAIAISLYTGIVYDTGSFRYSCTSRQTHEYVGRLVSQFDFDKNAIYEILFENRKVESLCLQMKVFNSLEMHRKGKVAVTMLENGDYKCCNAEENDAIELVRVGSSIEGVDFSIFIHEKADKIKVSLRSKSDFNVNAVSKKYNGGGHVKASGFSMKGTAKDVKNKILDDLLAKYDFFLSTGENPPVESPSSF